MRTYSVNDIVRMRKALDAILTPVNRAFYRHEINQTVELQLRTYMQNGTSPEELEQHLLEMALVKYPAFAGEGGAGGSGGMIG